MSVSVDEDVAASELTPFEEDVTDVLSDNNSTQLPAENSTAPANASSVSFSFDAAKLKHRNRKLKTTRTPDTSIDVVESSESVVTYINPVYRKFISNSVDTYEIVKNAVRANAEKIQVRDFRRSLSFSDLSSMSSPHLSSSSLAEPVEVSECGLGLVKQNNESKNATSSPLIFSPKGRRSRRRTSEQGGKGAFKRLFHGRRMQPADQQQVVNGSPLVRYRSSDSFFISSLGQELVVEEKPPEVEVTVVKNPLTQVLEKAVMSDLLLDRSFRILRRNLSTVVSFLKFSGDAHRPSQKRHLRALIKRTTSIVEGHTQTALERVEGR